MPVNKIYALITIDQDPDDPDGDQARKILRQPVSDTQYGCILTVEDTEFEVSKIHLLEK